MANDSPIQLLVGLGNPGNEYEATRHNAGAWFIEHLAREWGFSFNFEPKFQGRVASGIIDGHKIKLFLPSTYMNVSGQPVRALSQFYQIPPESILVAHDELDFAPGVIRLKKDGGHGGHNGLRDIIKHLNSANFNRLRIGIGHPGDKSLTHNFVLSRPSKAEYGLILDAFTQMYPVLPDLLSGNIQAAMTKLHTSAISSL